MYSDFGLFVIKRFDKLISGVQEVGYKRKGRTADNPGIKGLTYLPKLKLIIYYNAE